MSSVDMREIAKSLDSFLNGLSECGLLRAYTVEICSDTIIDVPARQKFRLVVNEFMINLQELLLKLSRITGEDNTNTEPSKELLTLMEFVNDELSINDTSAAVDDKTILDLPNVTTGIEDNDQLLPVAVDLLVSGIPDVDLIGNDLLTDSTSILDNAVMGSMKEMILKNGKKNHIEWKCNMCENIFRTMKLLRQHCLKEHDGVGCFECNLCGRRCMTKSSLIRHIGTHSRTKEKHDCSICGKKMSRKDNLNVHYIKHVGGKLFPCNRCKKKFYNSSELKEHEKIHLQQAEYICEECGKKFKRRDKLREHVMRHMKIRRYQCVTCDKWYMEKRDLRKHFKTIHPQLSF